MDFDPSYDLNRDIRELLRDKPDLDELKLKRSGETYTFRFDQNSRDALLQTLGKMAGARDYAMNWYDAAVLSQALKKIGEGQLQTYSSMRQYLNKE